MDGRMTYALAVVEVILQVPVIAALAFCLAYRLRRHKWWMRPWVLIVSSAASFASVLLVYYQFHTSQSSPSEPIFGIELPIVSLFGIGALFLAEAAALRAKSSRRNEPA